jgi:hypothetical protein
MSSDASNLAKQLELQRAEQAALAAKIRASEELAEQLERGKSEINNTLPPFEEITLRHKESVFEDNMLRQKIQNKRRENSPNVVLNLLLLIAVCACLWWAYQQFHHLWIAP